MSDTLRHLAKLNGIAVEYHDIWGTSHRVGDDTLRALLDAMGIDASTNQAVDEAVIAAIESRWRRMIDPVTVVRAGAHPLRVPLRTPARFDGVSLRWRVIAEDGREWHGELDPATLSPIDRASIKGVTHDERTLSLDVALTCGYHRLAISDVDGVIAEASLIATPARCYSPAALAENGRAWGVAVQLYGLRSPSNWGSGDFTDLRTLATSCASAGASLVGVNPLHVRNPNDPAEASPYAASSRLFVDPQYLDVEAIADLAECAQARELVASSAFQATLQKLRDSELVDWAGASDARNTVLEMLYASFRKRHVARRTARSSAFRRYCEEGGETLRRYAIFEALREHFHRLDANAWGWPAWPAAYRDPASAAVARFFVEHKARVEYFAYLQWQADLQLAAASRGITNDEAGIGLYRDLAVSVDRGGAEVWTDQNCYAHRVSVGAPPDDFSLLGQDWGIAPWIPSRLRDDAYTPFVSILRANMRHAGALRIDHVMALARLFWIPQGAPPSSGAYVEYPLHDLLGIVALESERNHCLVIGEDLGTVPDTMRAALRDANVLSYDVFYFERRTSGDFKSPDEYDAQAIAVVSTHDLPTLAGWWEGRDLALRDALGLFPDAGTRDRQVAARAEDRARLLRALAGADLLPEGAGLDPADTRSMTHALARAIHVYLARTPAKLVVAQLEDIIGALDQTNLPGTIEQHPNWRRKLSLSIEQLQRDVRFDDIARAISRERSLRR